MASKPLPVPVLASALQDSVHIETGKTRPAKAIRSLRTEAARLLGSKGGTSTAAKMTDKQRRTRAQTAAVARWAKKPVQ